MQSVKALWLGMSSGLWWWGGLRGYGIYLASHFFPIPESFLPEEKKKKKAIQCCEGGIFLANPLVVGTVMKHLPLQRIILKSIPNCSINGEGSELDYASIYHSKRKGGISLS